MPELGLSVGIGVTAGAARAVEPQATRGGRQPDEAQQDSRPAVPAAGLGSAPDRLEIQGAVQAPEASGEGGLDVSSQPSRSREVVFNADFQAFQNAIRVGDEEIARLPPDSLLKARQAIDRFVQDHFTAPAEETVGDLLGQEVDTEA